MGCQVISCEGLEAGRGEVAGRHCAEVVQPVIGMKLLAIGIVVTNYMAIRGITKPRVTGPRALRLQVRWHAACEFCQEGVAGDNALSSGNRDVEQRRRLVAEGKAMVTKGASERNGVQTGGVGW